MNLFTLALLVRAVVLTVGQDAVVNERRFLELVEKVENDAIELARQVEALYQNRCELALLGECIRGNYDHCSSFYPGQTCPGGEDLNSPLCGDGVACSTLYSFETSSVALPEVLADGPNGNPTDPQVVETICFTRPLDDYLKQKRMEDAPFWAELGFQPNYLYFGSHTGVFRISPATHYQTCGTYDPRVRPWYAAASSGPKNIVMVLDTSGSMLQNDKIGILKEAAIRVVRSSTVGDRIAVVPFGSEAQSLANEGGVLYIGDEDSKEVLVDRIMQLEAKGATNFISAFEEAFSILDISFREEVAVNCNTVIIFLTDGIMTPVANVTEEDVINIVKSGVNELLSNFGSTTYLFTYSVSGGDIEINRFPKALACAVDNGVWSNIENDEDIIGSLSSYYTFFALGLGTGPNEDFTAWVEPYPYIPGDTLGTTVSAPVYDRSKIPHLFLGVVGIDFTLAALDAALGVTSSEESFRRIVRRSTARCPRLELSSCELESYRRQSNVGDEGLCSLNCTSADFVQIEAEKCSAVSDYPTDLWQNNDLQGVEYTKKACCEVGGTEAIETCDANQNGKASTNLTDESSSVNPLLIALVASLVGVIVATTLVVAIFWIRAKKKSCFRGKNDSTSGGTPFDATEPEALADNSRQAFHEVAVRTQPYGDAPGSHGDIITDMASSTDAPSSRSDNPLQSKDRCWGADGIPVHEEPALVEADLVTL